MYNSGSTSKVLRDTKSGRKRGLSLYMSKQRKKKKIAVVTDGKKKLNIAPNYCHSAFRATGARFLG